MGYFVTGATGLVGTHAVERLVLGGPAVDDPPDADGSGDPRERDNV